MSHVQALPIVPFVGNAIASPGSAIAAARRRVVEQRSYLGTPHGTRALARRVREEGLTYCSRHQLASLVRRVRDIERSGLPGRIVETGCARGGSAIMLCAVKNRGRPLDVYDVFGMIPEPSERDGTDMQERYAEIASGRAFDVDGGQYYAYDDDLLASVVHQFVSHRVPPEENAVRFFKGTVRDTLRVDDPVALAHVDVDWYEPVRHCLEQLVPHVVVGGSIVLHAYSDWSGCRTATDEYFDAIGRQAFDFDWSSGHLAITRTA